MSTLDNIKETLTNKIDELRNDISSDSTGQDNSAEHHNDEVSKERDLQDVPDNNTETLDETPEDDLIAEDNLATDYDLIQTDVEDEDLYDSGLDDIRDEEIPEEIINDSEGNLIENPDVLEVSETREYDPEDDSFTVSEERFETETVQSLDGDEENRLEGPDELYNTSETPDNNLND